MGLFKESGILFGCSPFQNTPHPTPTPPPPPPPPTPCSLLPAPFTSNSLGAGGPWEGTRHTTPRAAATSTSDTELGTHFVFYCAAAICYKACRAPARGRRRAFPRVLRAPSPKPQGGHNTTRHTQVFTHISVLYIVSDSESPLVIMSALSAATGYWQVCSRELRNAVLPRRNSGTT
jgi:hypothetical protein